MSMIQSRRQFVATSLAGACGVVGLRTRPSHAEPPLETTKIRLSQIDGICVAPQYVAEELLKIEGFTDIQYVEFPYNPYPAFASGKVDLSMAFVAPFITQVDVDAPLGLSRAEATGTITRSKQCARFVMRNGRSTTPRILSGSMPFACTKRA